MSSSFWARVQKRLTGDSGRLWTHARRQAALQELEKQFGVRLTEEEVFKAATLFFSLLTNAGMIDKEGVAQQVRRQFLEFEKGKAKE